MSMVSLGTGPGLTHFNEIKINSIDGAYVTDSHEWTTSSISPIPTPPSSWCDRAHQVWTDLELPDLTTGGVLIWCHDQGRRLRKIIEWVVIVIPLSIFLGLFVGYFYYLMNLLNQLRETYLWLPYLLPAGGLAQGIIFYYLGPYGYWGSTPQEKDKGIVSGIGYPVKQMVKNEPNLDHLEAIMPHRITLLIGINAALSQLVGASLGAEAPAVHMSVSITSTYEYFLLLYNIKLIPYLASCSSIFSYFRFSFIPNHRSLLVYSIAAGFAGAFATPLAAAIFAHEILSFDASELTIPNFQMVSTLIVSGTADWAAKSVLTYFDDPHVKYPSIPVPSQYDETLTAQLVFCLFVFGVLSFLFAYFLHLSQKGFQYLLPGREHWAPFIGGVCLLIVVLISDNQDILGMGTFSYFSSGFHSTIASSVLPGGCTTSTWYLKFIASILSLGSGFFGGEVLGLFFIGASLGNVIAVAFGSQWVSLFAAMGMVSMLAGAGKCPLASLLICAELFGYDTQIVPNDVPQNMVLNFLFACAAYSAYWISGMSFKRLHKHTKHSHTHTEQHDHGEDKPRSPKSTDVSPGQMQRVPLSDLIHPMRAFTEDADISMVKFHGILDDEPEQFV
ncbi:MAG: voltage-gated chloride channel protein [Sylvanvirus sp.]|uniref:Voltage-gated chloride channel protein n=1 Tax=Sylvanvirus sp. TaxID=2487774 RepID=A0A3G5AKA7_9VIRU|nr:MAG: voltage-gated chloride channel protein [Sylvanvirus sp.]